MSNNTKETDYYARHHDETPISEEWLLENGWEVEDGEFYHRESDSDIESLPDAEWGAFTPQFGSMIIRTIGQLNQIMDLERSLAK